MRSCPPQYARSSTPVNPSPSLFFFPPSFFVPSPLFSHFPLSLPPSLFVLSFLFFSILSLSISPQSHRDTTRTHSPVPVCASVRVHQSQHALLHSGASGLRCQDLSFSSHTYICRHVARGGVLGVTDPRCRAPRGRRIHPHTN